MKKIYVAVSCALFLTACQKSQSPASATETTKPEPTVDSSPEVYNTSSMELYEAFLHNEADIQIRTEYNHYGALEFEKVLSDGSYYLLPYIKELSVDYLRGEWGYTDDIHIEPEVEYAYLDCGNDGDPELAIRITYPTPNENWRQYFVIKAIDGQLYEAFSTDEWSRRSVSMNEYGYIELTGSNSASSYAFEKSFVDARGEWKFLFGENSEAYLMTLYYNGEFYDFSQYEDAMKGIIFFSFYFEPEWSETRPYTYSYVRYDAGVESDNDYFFWKLVDDNSIYAEDSVYMTAFREAGIPVVPLNDVEALIENRKADFGFEEIYKTGKPANWTVLQ